MSALTKSLRPFDNYDGNCVPDDTSVIHPPLVCTSAEMEVLITHQTGKYLSYMMWVYLQLCVIIWMTHVCAPTHIFGARCSYGSVWLEGPNLCLTLSLQHPFIHFEKLLLFFLLLFFYQNTINFFIFINLFYQIQVFNRSLFSLSNFLLNIFD